jgi:TPR repeat protein
MGGRQIRMRGLDRIGWRLLLVITIGLLQGCGHWDDIRWVAQKYEQDWAYHDPAQNYQDYLSKEAKTEISLEDYVSYFPFYPRRLTGTVEVMAIHDTDKPDYKIAVSDNGHRCTFVLQEGRWKRTWDVPLVEEATDLIDAARYQEGIALLNRAVAVDPYDPHAYLKLSLARRKNKALADHLKAALESARMAEKALAFAQSASATASVEVEMGEIFYESRDVADADRHFLKALKVAPNDDASNFSYARFLFGSGRPLVGARYLAKAFRGKYCPTLGQFAGVLKPVSAQVKKSVVQEWTVDANAGDVGAQMALGLAQVQGLAGRKDAVSGARWIRTAASAGAENACVYMADFCEKGTGVHQDPGEAMRWLFKGAACGNEYAQRGLGHAYAAGTMVPKDLSRAAQFYLSAARQGDGASLGELGRFNLEGMGRPVDVGQAFRYYRSAALAGDDRGQTMLAFLYEHGRGVAQDPRKAVYWYLMSVDHDPVAGRHLGSMYARGAGVKMDQALVAKYFRRAAELGDGSSQGILGLYLWNGIGIRRDRKAAVGWYEKGARSGDNQSMLYLGQKLLKGEFVKRDKKAGLGWIEMAAEQGYPRAEEMLGNIFLSESGADRNPSKGVEWLQKAADLSDTAALNDLGYAYETGKGVPMNELKSLELYRKSAVAGDAYAQSYIGRAYEAGRGMDRDPHEAILWFKLAAAQGDTYSIGRLRALDPTWAPSPGALPAPGLEAATAGRPAD